MSTIDAYLSRLVPRLERESSYLRRIESSTSEVLLWIAITISLKSREAAPLTPRWREGGKGEGEELHVG